VGIILNAILPGKDYEFGKNPKGDKAVDFEINPSLRKDRTPEK
jgi:uracil permease